MPSLETVRKWLRGDYVPGLPTKWCDPGSFAQAVLDDVKELAKVGEVENDAKPKKKRKPKKKSKTERSTQGKYKISLDGGNALLKFGKHNGMTIKGLAKRDPGYLDWIMAQDDFSDELKEIIRVCSASCGRYYPPSTLPILEIKAAKITRVTT